MAQPSRSLVATTIAGVLLGNGTSMGIRCAGGCAALVASRLPDWGQRVASIRAGSSWIGLACIGFAFVHYTAETPWPGIHAALPVFGAALIVLSGTRSASLGAGRLLEFQPLPWIGTISYSIYLVHWPLIQFVQARHGYGFPLSPQVRLSMAALSIPVAWLLYRFVENPVRLARWLRPTRRTLFLAAVSSLVVVVLAVGLTPIVNSQAHLLLSRLSDAEHVSELTAPRRTSRRSCPATSTLQSATQMRALSTTTVLWTEETRMQPYRIRAATETEDSRELVSLATWKLLRWSQPLRLLQAT